MTNAGGPASFPGRGNLPVEPQPRVTGVVLAGGHSRRLGLDKALLTTASGETLIAHVVRALTACCTEVLLAVDRPGRPLPEGVTARVVVDAVLDRGPLGGISSGLRAAAEQRCLVVACDLPFVQPALLELLLRERDGQAVVPRAEGRVQPLMALYQKACLPAIEAMLDDGELRVDRLLTRVHVTYVEEPELREVDPDLRSFFNINRPEDLRRARDLGF